ncbi:MAG: GIY-YIG nuclease family protein [Candidatus Methanofastidiosum sp.]|jgi:hypothetical protein|nr:GIY-YIG nuclease family protein [Methanofastidiosum sp.]
MDAQDNKFITIQEILNLKGELIDEKTKLVKHATRNYDLYKSYRENRDAVLAYQCHQDRDIFNGADHIVSFIGEDCNRARFIGVFKVDSVIQLSHSIRDPISKEFYKYNYTLIEDERFTMLRDRIIISWGKGRLWCQNYINAKEVIEIQPGLHFKQFTDYMNFTLTFRELKEIVDSNYQDWKRALSNVNGIYMIVNSKEQKQYIGSTYGIGGIWGRWTEYVKTNGTGSNILLQACSSTDPGYTDHITFTLLDILPRSISQKQAVERESLFKIKFGSRAMGLNAN